MLHEAHSLRSVWKDSRVTEIKGKMNSVMTNPNMCYQESSIKSVFNTNEELAI